MTNPDWAHWPAHDRPTWTLGAEEEVMLLDGEDLSLASAIDDVLPRLPPSLREHATSETHTSAVELATGVHATVGEALAELRELRHGLAAALEALELRAARGWSTPTATAGWRCGSSSRTCSAPARRTPPSWAAPKSSSACASSSMRRAPSASGSWPATTATTTAC